MTQAELARRSGVRQPSLSAIENGRLVPRPETLERILRAARLRPAQLLFRHDLEVRSLAVWHRALAIRMCGAAARGEDTSGDEVQLLVTFAEQATYFDLVGLRLDLEDLLGRPVCVLSDEGESPVVRRARSEALAW